MGKLNAVSDWFAIVRLSGYHAKEMASQCALSLKQLERYFCLRAGMPPQFWADQVRMQDAIRFLATEQISVKELAAKLDFHSSEHFCKKFKAYYGLTPTGFKLFYSKSVRDSVLRLAEIYGGAIPQEILKEQACMWETGLHALYFPSAKKCRSITTNVDRG